MIVCVFIVESPFFRAEVVDLCVHGALRSLPKMAYWHAWHLTLQWRGESGKRVTQGSYIGVQTVMKSRWWLAVRGKFLISKLYLVLFFPWIASVKISSCYFCISFHPFLLRPCAHSCWILLLFPSLEHSLIKAIYSLVLLLSSHLLTTSNVDKGTNIVAFMNRF